MLRQFRETFAYHSRWTSRLAEEAVRYGFNQTLQDLNRFGFGELAGKRVLDLGCGQRFTFALQCASSGASVTALDVDYVKPDILPLALYRIITHNGIKRALQSVLRRILFDRRYYQALEAFASRPLLCYSSKIRFVLADANHKHYPLPDQSYDLIACNNVLEHIEDLPGFATEVRRLLADKGYFYAIIHNYYSISGGHHLGWNYPDESPPSKVPPWDHLRENRYPAFQYLNRCKPEEYRQTFAEHLEILLFEGRDRDHQPGGLEGQTFLTKELETELCNYPKELLLTRSWCLICQKN